MGNVVCAGEGPRKKLMCNVLETAESTGGGSTLVGRDSEAGKGRMARSLKTSSFPRERTLPSLKSNTFRKGETNPILK